MMQWSLQLHLSFENHHFLGKKAPKKLQKASNPTSEDGFQAEKSFFLQKSTMPTTYYHFYALKSQKIDSEPPSSIFREIRLPPHFGGTQNAPKSETLRFSA